MQEAIQKRHDWIRGVILLGFTMMLARMMLTGSISHYLAPRLHFLGYVTLVILLLLTGASFWRAVSGREAYACGCEDRHQLPSGIIRSLLTYGLFALPLLMAFLMPDKILGSAVAEKRGLNLPVSAVSRAAAADPETDRQEQQAAAQSSAELDNVEAVALAVDKKKEMSDAEIRQLFEANNFGDFYTDLATLMYNQEIIDLNESIFLDGITTLELYPQHFAGHQLEMVGFVYREPDMPANQFVAARFSVSCCTADAAVYGILVEEQLPETFAKDSWVKVKGELELRKVNDYEMLVLKATDITPVEAPKDPYVYYNFTFDQ